MKILIAPDSFKGSLSAPEAAQAMARGLSRVQGIETDMAPIADGGEGFAQTLCAAAGGRMVSVAATDPLGRRCEAAYARLPDDTAVIEVAAASGLTLLSPAERDPLAATSYGTGELMAAAQRAGCKRFVLGLGGSATNDGGAGLLAALGIRFLDESGYELPPGGGALERLVRIDATDLPPCWQNAEIAVACDVDNPLCGVTGAAAVFGPQKGAGSAEVALLDRALARFGAVIQQMTGVNVCHIPGAGAAGGMGGGLQLLPGTKLLPGFEIAARYTRLAERLRAADAVLTGEGCTDASSRRGKVPSGIGKLALALHKPAFCLSGSLGPGYEQLLEAGIAACFSMVTGPMCLDEAMGRAGFLLEAAAEQLGRLLIAGHPAPDSPLRT